MLNKLTYSTYVPIPDLKFITRDGSCQSTEIKLKAFLLGHHAILSIWELKDLEFKLYYTHDPYAMV